MQKHNRRSIRLPGYDYSQPGWYFITICTFKHQDLFGYIDDGHMILNDVGEIAKNCWMSIQDHFPNTKLDEYIIMPNHVHGIIEMKADNNDLCRGMACHAHSKHKQLVFRKFGKPVKHSLSSVIGAYKSSVSREINILRNRPREIVWQRNYFERVIRNEQELFAIRKYIINNPKNFK